MNDFERRLSVALQVTETAATVALSYFRDSPSVETKADQSPVTIADKQTENSIRDGLLRAFPDDAIFGEELGQTGAGDDMWIIDPIDGTRSFITGLPLFGMLLGYVSAQGPQLGVIRMPALNEVYTGMAGRATCNSTPIRTSNCTKLAQANLFINEGDKLAVQEPLVFGHLATAGALRRMGADCYPHALVARGMADAVVDYNLQAYDYLPVSAVVEAAGGIMTDWQGKPLTMHSDGRTLTAATPQLHRELLALVNG